MTSLIFGLIGLLVGGLINVLADDLPARVRPQWPHCPRCKHQHRPLGWLSLGRLLFQNGRCPNCELPTRRRAIAVEVGTAITFAILPLAVPDYPNVIIDALYMAILILVIVIDLEHRLILHVVTFPSTLTAIALSSLQFGENSIVLSLLGAVAGFFFFYIFFWFGQRFFGPGALGFGDVTLSMTMGAMLGVHFIIFTLILGILIGGIVSGLLIVTRILSMRHHIPYGQFLAVAGMIMLIWGPQLMNWYFGI